MDASDLKGLYGEATKRMAARALPVTVRFSQSVGTRGLAPRITSTTSPLVSGVRSGLSSPLIFTPTASLAPPAKPGGRE